MKKTIKTTLIILTRNEIEGVKATLRTIPFEAVDEYFAVDYQSKDGTVEFFEKNGVRVIHQKTPGRAEAFRIGVREAKGDYVIFYSPDGNENAADIVRIVHELKNGADLVIASRFLKGSRNEEDDQALKFRAWANQGFTVLVNLFWGGRLTDSINGYRGISKKVFNDLHIDAQGFAVEFQMSIRALKKKLKIVEFPTIEGSRIGGQSGSAAIPTGVKFLKYLWREIVIGTNF